MLSVEDEQLANAGRPPGVLLAYSWTSPIVQVNTVLEKVSRRVNNLGPSLCRGNNRVDHRFSDSLPGVGLGVGGGVGVAVGVAIAGGPGIAVVICVGAGLGLVAGFAVLTPGRGTPARSPNCVSVG